MRGKINDEKQPTPEESMRIEREIIEAYFRLMDAAIETKLYIAQIKGRYCDVTHLRENSNERHQPSCITSIKH